MGASKVVPSERSKSHYSYYVAMAVIMGLLVVLCCYACYFFINKFRELSSNDSPSTTPSTSCPKKEPVSYPVQPVVRDSAVRMAALCRQLPPSPAPAPAPAPGYTLQGDQVFPAGRSPDPRPAHTDLTTHPHPHPHPQPAPDKIHAVAAVVPCVTIQADG